VWGTVKIPKIEKRRVIKKMNKRLCVALILPLFLIPMASFAYGHFYAYVAKRYAIHVGSVAVSPVYFHIDQLTMLDVNNNGIIVGDEFNYSIHQDPATGKWYVDMIADPIPSGFVLDTTLKIHIDGKLPVRFNYGELPAGGYWAMNFTNGALFDVFPDWNNGSINWLSLSTLPGVTNNQSGPWSYTMTLTFTNATGTYPVPGSTLLVYYPCNNITIAQHLDFRQPGTVVGETWNPLDWECHHILIRFEFQFIEESPTIISSWTAPPPTYPMTPP
jgi:hypothetical protein